MIHVAFLNNTPWGQRMYQRYHTYPDFVSFDQDRQNANAAPQGLFWTNASPLPYVLQNMAENRNKISNKYLQKQRENIASTIEVGFISQKFLVLIRPGKQNSHKHAYLFFPTGDTEINNELTRTWS